MEQSFNKKIIQLDQYSKEALLQNAFQFYHNPFKEISRDDLKNAKLILNELENWELEYGKKEFSTLKNNSVLVSYLAFRFGELLGLKKKDLSKLYIAGLIESIGKKYVCGEDFQKAYDNIFSHLRKGDDGFEKVKVAFRKYPTKTQEYLENKYKFSRDIVNTAVSYHSVHSNLFSRGYPNIDKDLTQLDILLWFANSLSAISFSSNELLKRNYRNDKYVSIIEALEILRDQTESKIPMFWSRASNATLMGVIFALSLGITSPSKVKSANYTSEEVVNLVNEYRSANGLEIVDVDLQLVEAARKKAMDMFEKDYWDHTGPNGETAWQFIKAEGYSYSIAGENLAKGFNDVNKMNQAWLNSPSHKQNIADPEYTEIGVAVMDGNLKGKNVTLVVQIFAHEKETPSPIQVQDYEKLITNIKDFLSHIISRFTKF